MSGNNTSNNIVEVNPPSGGPIVEVRTGLSGGGAINPFNQSLNTTNNVTFHSVGSATGGFTSLSAGSFVASGTVSWPLYQAVAGADDPLGGYGGTAGSITLDGGNANDDGTFAHGGGASGNINLSGGSSDGTEDAGGGGSIISTGGPFGNAGGSILLSCGSMAGQNGGSINLSGGTTGYIQFPSGTGFAVISSDGIDLFWNGTKINP